MEALYLGFTNIKCGGLDALVAAATRWPKMRLLEVDHRIVDGDAFAWSFEDLVEALHMKFAAFPSLEVVIESDEDRRSYLENYLFI